MPTTASIRINGGTAGLADTNLPLGTVVNLSNNDNTGVVSHEWVIVSQPAGAQDDLDPPALNPIVSNAPAPQFTPTKEGSYLIKLTVNKDMADEATDTTICAVRELLTGDRIPAPQETTEVSDKEGWATTAVTKILQRVTRMSDAGIFVAQNASAGDLSLGKVVHMNGMATIGTGTNQRPIPTVDLALGNVLDTVDGPLGVMVGNRDGDPLAVAVGGLCRVMVMGGIAGYTSLGTGGAQGDPVFVGNDGSLSLTAGFYVRQVGDIAKVITDGVYDIAISAGANSIPRGNAGNDLSGAYPDPTVARINGTIVGASTGAAVGNVLRVTDILTPEAEWGPVDLANTAAVTGILPAANGGTGQNMTPNAGGIVYGTADSKLDITAAGTAGYLLKSNGTSAPSWLDTVPVLNGGTGRNTALTANGLIFASSTTQMASLSPGTLNYVLLSGGAGSGPSWSQYVPLGSGGTGGTLAAAASYSVIVKAASAQLGATAAPTANQVLRASAASPFAPEFGAINLASTAAVSGTLPVTNGGTGVTSLTLNGVVYGGGSGDVGVTTAASAGAILTGTIAGVPTWKTAGTEGQILTLNNISPGIDVLDWQDFGTYFDAQYASSTATATNVLFTTTSNTPATVRSVTLDLKPGVALAMAVPSVDSDQLETEIIILNNNTVATATIRYVIQFPDATTDTYTYYFHTAESHKNNQRGGSFTIPPLVFQVTQAGSYVISLQAAVTTNDTLNIRYIRLRVTQG